MSENAATVETTEAPARKSVGTFNYLGGTYHIKRKPSGFMMAELGAQKSDDPAAMGTMLQFFKHVMDEDEYARLREAGLADESDTADGFTALGEAMAEIMLATLDRPTK